MPKTCFVIGPIGASGTPQREHANTFLQYIACGHRSEPDPADQARWYGPQTPMPEWRRRLVCSQCGSRDVDMVVIGEKR